MNKLKSYVRRTILASATEGAWPKKRRTAESTKAAFMDAMRGTDTGWWTDLIYTAPMLEMAHRYRREIGAALVAYREEVGEPYVYRPHDGGDEIDDGRILSGLLSRRPYTLAEYHTETPAGRAAEGALLGLRFAVEWYAGELAREYCPDL